MSMQRPAPEQRSRTRTNQPGPLVSVVHRSATTSATQDAGDVKPATRESPERLATPAGVTASWHGDLRILSPSRRTSERIRIERPFGTANQDTESDQKRFRKVFVRVACAGHQLMF